MITKPFLFVSDLDNTLVGDAQSLNLLNQKLEFSRRNYGTKIVYATGRSRSSYQQLCQQQKLLIPDALIACVGTEIYYHNFEEPDHSWWAILQPHWHRPTIVSIAANLPQLIPQPEPEQRPYKVSYFLNPEAAPTVLPKLEQLLQQQKLQIQLIYSSNKDLDILPQKADKGQAMQYLQNCWQIEPSQTVVCGDSGNDIALFNVGNERGIIVANAQLELLNWLEHNPCDNHYLAKEKYAGGIQEGLEHFNFIQL